VEEFCANRIRELEEAATELMRAMPKEQAAPEGYVTIQGHRHIRDKIANMIAGAQERIYLSASGETLEYALPRLKEALAAGRKVVIITSPPFALAGATVYQAPKDPGQIRLIVDSATVLTGDVMSQSGTCLFSRKQNLVDLIKESLKNEMRLIDLMG